VWKAGWQKIEGATAVKVVAPSKLNRKVFKLPGSIWREDSATGPGRQPKSDSTSVKVCGPLCKKSGPSTKSNPQLLDEAAEETVRLPLRSPIGVGDTQR